MCSCLIASKSIDIVIAMGVRDLLQIKLVYKTYNSDYVVRDYGIIIGITATTPYIVNEIIGIIIGIISFIIPYLTSTTDRISKI